MGVRVGLMTGRMIMRVASTSARYAAAAKCRSFCFNNSIKATETTTKMTMKHKASKIPTQVFLPFFYTCQMEQLLAQQQLVWFVALSTEIKRRHNRKIQLYHCDLFLPPPSTLCIFDLNVFEGFTPYKVIYFV